MTAIPEIRIQACNEGPIRFDRPWVPERPVFGTVRSMSSDSSRRKLKVGGYIERYARRAAQMPLL